jgi:Tfp pilus assembly protein PilN
MIKINLLGVMGGGPAPVPTAGAPPSSARHAITFVGALVVFLIVVGFFYRIWSSDIDHLQVRLREEKAEQQRLEGIRQENLKYLQRRKDLEQRINTIQMLQNSRVGPVTLMQALANTISKTKDLYLSSMRSEGARLVLSGESNTVEAIADLVTAMKANSTFEDVQLRQYYEDDRETKTTYKFNIDFIQHVPQPATAEGQAATATKGTHGGGAVPQPRGM